MFITEDGEMHFSKGLFIVANATVSLITGRSSHTDVRLHKRKEI